MKRSLATVLLIVLLGATPAPTPTVNGQSYDDLGMHFTAPAQFHPLFQRKMKVSELDADPGVVAGWTTYGQHPHRLLIALSLYNFTLDGWDKTYTQTLRNQGESTMLKNAQSIVLKNGMPARYLEMTTGTGFAITKGYIVMWVDGQRGVAVILTALVGELDEKSAKEILLGDASAVRYPLDREEDHP